MGKDSRGHATPGTSTAPADAAEVPRIEGVLVGTLVRGGPAGAFLVDHPANPSDGPLEARSVVSPAPEDVGREVALAFEEGDPLRPIILGFMHEAPVIGVDVSEDEGSPEAEVDGERLVFSAEKEIVFRCGKASITLTRAGKVLIRGAYVLSRSSGVNRIKGGSVQLN